MQRANTRVNSKRELLSVNSRQPQSSSLSAQSRRYFTLVSYLCRYPVKFDFFVNIRTRLAIYNGAKHRHSSAYT